MGWMFGPYFSRNAPSAKRIAFKAGNARKAVKARKAEIGGQSKAGGSSGQVFDGPWALFHLFDKAHINRSSQPEKFGVTFNIGGRKAYFDVVSGSVQNPFRLRELDQFRCPEHL